MLIRLYLLLCAFLTLGVDPPADPPADVDPPDDPDDGELPDLDADDPVDDPAPDDSDDPDAIRAQLKETKTRLEAAERNAREAADRAAAAERARPAAAAQPSDEERLFQQEEEVLKNPASTEQQRYWVNANRTLRDSARTSKQALMESREIADKADFDRYAATKPGIAKRYADRVEKKLVEIRATGANIPRKVVLKLLIGEDIVDGKVKTPAKRTVADGGGAQRVERGKPASARGDVHGRGGAKTEHQKRTARLENQII